MKARGLTWAGLGALGLLALVGCAPQANVATSQAQPPTVEPGMARVWFFRQSDPTGGNVYAADPIIYANGAPVGQIAQGTAFFHNFPPGKYRFTVQPFGTPTREHDTLQLEHIRMHEPEVIARAAEGDRAALDEVESAILAALQSNTRSELARPSMGQDMLKGRRTEIDFINGVIAAKGQEVGCPAPTHVKLVAAVKQVELGKIPAQPENLYAI